MNIIEAVLKNRTGAEVKEIYQEFKANGRNIEANQLRAAFIHKTVVSADSIKWSDELRFFIVEEAEDVRLKKDTFSREDEISKLTTFLIAKMMCSKEFVTSFPYLDQLFEREMALINESPSKIMALRYLLYGYVQRNVKREQNALIEFVERRNPEVQGIGNKILQKRSIKDYQQEIEKMYDRVDANLHTKNDVLCLLILLLGVQWQKGSLNEAKSLLLKAKELADKEDILYPVLSLLDKEVVVPLFV